MMLQRSPAQGARLSLSFWAFNTGESQRVNYR